MEKSLEILLQHRKVLYHYLKETPLEMLNTIPGGFRNNIFWNIAHSVVVQQALVYGLSDVPPIVSEDLMRRYRKGTVPEGLASEAELNEIKNLLFKTVERTSEDYQLGAFQKFRQYTTMTKVVLNDVDDAILFNNFHEGLHLGYIMALRKALSQ